MRLVGADRIARDGRKVGWSHVEFLVEWLAKPWPWYVTGPLLGLFAPLLIWIGNKRFGISSNLRHMCAMALPQSQGFFRYDWRKEGGWNLVFFAGVVIGGFLAGFVFRNPEPVAIASATVADLAALGVTYGTGLMPPDLFTWSGLASVPGFVLMVVGGFLVGFGARYAGGCTSGHGIAGLAELQARSLIALVGFFVGGIVVSFGLLPLLLGG